MQPEYESTAAKDKLPPIVSSSELAERLGFTRDPLEEPNSPVRSYLKEIESPLGKGILSLITKEGERNTEYIFIDVKIGRSNAWSKSFNLVADPVLKGRLEAKDEMSGFPRRVLTRGGYDAVSEYIIRLEEDGKFRADLAEIQKTKESARAIADTVLPLLQKEFPKFSQVNDFFDNEGEIHIFTPLMKNKHNTPALQLSPSRDGFSISVGKLKFDPLTGQPVGFKKELSAGIQGFPYEDRLEISKATHIAVAYLLSNLNQPPDKRVAWWRKDNDFSSILRKLGFKENGELVYLRHKILYNLLKNEPSALEDYDDAAKNVLNLLPEGSRKRAEIGFLAARARIFHLAGLSEESTVKMQEAINNALSQGLPNLAKILSEIDKEEFVHWDDLEK